jgi:hypothetical protein
MPELARSDLVCSRTDWDTMRQIASAERRRLTKYGQSPLLPRPPTVRQMRLSLPPGNAWCMAYGCIALPGEVLGLPRDDAI